LHGQSIDGCTLFNQHSHHSCETIARCKEQIRNGIAIFFPALAKVRTEELLKVVPKASRGSGQQTMQVLLTNSKRSRQRLLQGTFEIRQTSQMLLTGFFLQS
jgi:hypothetical protein